MIVRFAVGICALVAAFLQLEATWTTAVGVLAGIEAADFASGIFHWSVGNYGSGATKPRALGEIIAEFQGHHVTPQDIVSKGLGEVSFPGGRIVVPVLVLVAALGLPAFVVAFVGAVFLGQVLHKWSHQPPRVIAWLQSARLMLSQEAHVAHHRGGHADTYAIITGHTNVLLDRLVLPRLERVVHAWFGAEPHWKH